MELAGAALHPVPGGVAKALHKGGFDRLCGGLRKPGMFGSSLFRCAVNQAMATACFYELALRQRV